MFKPIIIVIAPSTKKQFHSKQIHKKKNNNTGTGTGQKREKKIYIENMA